MTGIAGPPLEPAPRLEPIEGILAILDHGAVTGTNKFALLLALLDAASTCSDDGTVTAVELAERLLEFQWDHALPFNDSVLRQVSSPNRDNTQVLTQILELRAALPAALAGLPFERTRNHLPTDRWFAAVAVVERDLWRNPIARLQRLPGDPPNFLFEQHTRPRRIAFLPGVPAALTRFAGVLRPLIEFRFAQFVARTNHQTIGSTVEQELQEHLFGVDRHMPTAAMRQQLAELQHDRCLYTGARLGGTTAQDRLSIDHVIPWTRQRLSSIENFVATTTTANSTKSSLLLGPVMLARWRDHVDDNAIALAAMAEAHGWPTAPGRVLEVMRSVYSSLDPATGTWDGPDHGVRMLGTPGKQQIAAILATATP